jgi:hypothetical protein
MMNISRPLAALHGEHDACTRFIGTQHLLHPDLERDLKVVESVIISVAYVRIASSEI